MNKSTRTRAETEDLHNGGFEGREGVQTQRKRPKAEESLVLHTWIFYGLASILLLISFITIKA